MCVSSQSIIINKSSYTSRSRALGASTLAHRASNTRDSVASITTSNPLWARACLLVQARPARL